MKPTQVLHVEVGGVYGGSLRALELYLQHTDRERLRHRLLLYYPTPGAERLRPLVDSIDIVQNHFAPSEPHHRQLPAWCPRPAGGWRGVIGLPVRRQLTHRLADRMRVSGCDLVHCNNSFWYQAPTLRAARRVGLALAAHVRNPPPNSRPTRRYARQARALLMLHESQARLLRSWRLPGIMAHCPDGIEAAPAPPQRVAELRRELNCASPGALLLGALGRLEAQKGFDVLIEAATKLLRTYPNTRLVIFGEGAQRRRLEARIATLGLNGRIRLPGFTPEPACALAAMDVFVCSSRWEGLPLAVLEALLAGRPVVATEAAIDGDPRLIPFLAGVAASGPAALSAALERVLTTAATGPAVAEAERERARRGGAWVRSEFAPAAAAGRLDEALLQTAARPLAGRSFYEHVYALPGWKRTANAPETVAARFTKVWYRACAERVLPRLPLADRIVLEVGCGYGHLLPLLRKRGARYIGVDIAASALRQVPTGEDGLAVLGDACLLPVADASCDVVLCMEVYEHLADPDRLVRELRRVVKPGGYVVLSSPNYTNGYLPLKLLADAGSGFCRDYIKRQPVDHTLFSFRVRRHLRRYFRVLEQRAIRLHPPLLERLESGPLRPVNNWIFHLEERFGTHPPWRWMGLHTCFVLQPRTTLAAVPAPAAPPAPEAIDCTIPAPAFTAPGTGVRIAGVQARNGRAPAWR